MTYRLLLLGTDPDANDSTGFFTRELYRNFCKAGGTETQLLIDVGPLTQLPAAEVCLVHAAATSLQVDLALSQRSRFRVVALFLELPVSGFDVCYCYLGKSSPRLVKIECPAVRRYYPLQPKVKHSVLLDHSLRGFPGDGRDELDWNSRLRNWFIPRSQYHTYQLGGRRTSECGPFPIIPVVEHDLYLHCVAQFETFVATHAGSYNHAAKDMAVMGTRVLVPRVPVIVEGEERQTFVPEELVETLGMITFEHEEELEGILSKPWTASPRIDLTTDMVEVVNIIDNDIRRRLR